GSRKRLSLYSSRTLQPRCTAELIGLFQAKLAAFQAVYTGSIPVTRSSQRRKPGQATWVHLHWCRVAATIGGRRAGVAHSVERNLAKVEVAGSKPVSRSRPTLRVPSSSLAALPTPSPIPSSYCNLAPSGSG